MKTAPGGSRTFAIEQFQHESAEYSPNYIAYITDYMIEGCL